MSCHVTRVYQIADYHSMQEFWNLTARQYGEVALPDAASDLVTCSPPEAGPEVVPVQGGYGAFFAVMVQVLCRTGVIAVQTDLGLRISHG